MSRMFIGGRDTTPEVDAIRAAIHSEPGRSVTYEDVARAAGLDVGSTRFRTVTERWRRMVERDTAIRIDVRDRAFHFLTADEALDRSKTDLHRIGRATGKMHARIGAIDVSALSEPRKGEHFLLARESAAMLDSVRRSAKAIQGPKAVRPANLRLAK